MRSVALVCAVTVSLVACGPDLAGPDGGSGGGGANAAGGGSAAGGAGGSGGAGGAGGSAGGTAGGMAGGAGGGAAGGSAGGAAGCSSANCLGCCFNGACQPGNTNAACGKNGSVCEPCATGKMCLPAQTCGIDPESTWKVQPSRATIRGTNGAGEAWDPLGGAPDSFAILFCPATAMMETARTPSVNDAFMATWTTGSCTMKAKDLMASGFAVEVWDADTAGNDNVLGKSTFKPNESQLLNGSLSASNNTTCPNITISFTRQ